MKKEYRIHRNDAKDAQSIFDALCAAMAIPAFYPHPVSRVERKDTHISAVFLTGEWVYKIKKNVQLGFLDFSRLEDRLRFCRTEVELNQRLSHGIYEGVVGIVRHKDGRFSMDRQGTIVEYAVKMRQLPDEACLKESLEKGTVTEEQMVSIGEALAAFYKDSARSTEIDHFGNREVIMYNVEENFRQLDPVVDEIVDRQRWDFLCQVTRSYFTHHEKLFDRRVKAGRICDGHGDLRCDHIYFHNGLQIIDCIEFNDRFRYGDAVCDLSFLHMEIEHLGHSSLSRDLLAAYAVAAHDPELYVLLDFYASYRAVVRLKTTYLQYRGTGNGVGKQNLKQSAKQYLESAYRYAIQFSRPTLWVFCGLPASGKSLLAKALGAMLLIPVFQSDRIRKERFPGEADTVVAFGKGLYRPAFRHQVYGQMLASAQDALRQGRSVILDATFSHLKWRDAVQLLASDMDTNVLFVECRCKEETILARLEAREKTLSLSDARPMHYLQMLQDFEPISELPQPLHITVDTEQPPEIALTALLVQSYTNKCEQITKLL